MSLDTGWSGWAGLGTRRQFRQVGEQVEFLQHRLTDQHLVAEHQGLFERVPTGDVEDDRLRDLNLFFAAVRVLRDPVAPVEHAQLFLDVCGNDGPDGPGVHQGVGVIRPHFRLRIVAPAEAQFVHRIGDLRLSPGSRRSNRSAGLSVWDRRVESIMDRPASDGLRSLIASLERAGIVSHPVTPGPAPTAGPRRPGGRRAGSACRPRYRRRAGRKRKEKPAPEGPGRVGGGGGTGGPGRAAGLGNIRRPGAAAEQRGRPGRGRHSR